MGKNGPDKLFEFTSEVAADELADGWRRAILAVRGGGVVSALRGQIQFGRPPAPSANSDPFQRREPDPIFSAYADIPLGRASSQSAMVGLFIFVSPAGGYLGRVTAVSGGLGTSAHRKYFEAAVAGLKQADPRLCELT